MLNSSLLSTSGMLDKINEMVNSIVVITCQKKFYFTVYAVSVHRYLSN